MRILYLTEERISFTEPMVRGGAIHVQKVVEGLRKRGHDVTLLDWSSSSPPDGQVSVSPPTRFIAGPVLTALSAISVGSHHQFDVVVSKTRKTYLPGLIAATWLDVPHVVHVGSSLDRDRTDLLSRLDAASLVMRLRAPHDGYFVVCEHIAAQLIGRGVPQSRIYDVKNAVDTDRFHPTDVPVPLGREYREKISKLNSDVLHLGFVGGLHAYKGLDDFADALDRTRVDCEAVIAGDGPERARLERYFGESAVFLGAVPYEQVPALYHEMDALVLPSYTEGLPRVVLEAQATAIPVVATRVGGVPEAIEHGRTGLLCAPRHPTELADCIDRLADSDERERLGRNGRSAVTDAFSWDRMYERYERYLNDVVR